MFAADYPPDEVTATPEYVLSILRLMAGVELELDETWNLEDFFEFLDDLARPTASKLGDIINAAFVFNIPDQEWRAAFPKLNGTIGDLCQFLAPRIPRPVVRPWMYGGKPCLPAGAFFTLRHLLSQSGVNCDRIKPSTSLEPYAERLGSMPLLTTLAKLTPDRLPTIKRHYRSWFLLVPAYLVLAPAATLAVLFGTLVTVVSAFSNWKFAMAAGLVTVLSVTVTTTAYRWLTRRLRTEIVGMLTFRDLAYHIAGQSRVSSVLIAPR